jgi:hypothetical protein
MIPCNSCLGPATDALRRLLLPVRPRPLPKDMFACTSFFCVVSCRCHPLMLILVFLVLLQSSRVAVVTRSPIYFFPSV